MAFLQVQFFSDALEVASTVNVILPEPSQGVGLTASAEESLPKVLYLLHGYSDDHTIWMRRTSVERYAAEHNLAVIMPAVNHSFYTNEPMGERYWDYVSEELPRTMHRFFRLSDKPEDTFVAGLSMGGYGAMKLALTHPERFGAAGCFSGAVDIVSMLAQEGARSNLVRIFGTADDARNSEHDLFHLMAEHGQDAHKPRLFVACGTSDFLYGQYQKFIPALQSHNWSVTFSEKPGAIHEWGYWDELIARFIPWAVEGT